MPMWCDAQTVIIRFSLNFTPKFTDAHFPCMFCSRVLKFQSPNLLRHIQVFHAEQLPFKCPCAGCAKSFLDENQLNRHVGQAHKCKDCAGTHLQGTLFNKSELALHKLTRHGKIRSCGHHGTSKAKGATNLTASSLTTTDKIDRGGRQRVTSNSCTQSASLNRSSSYNRYEDSSCDESNSADERLSFSSPSPSPQCPSSLTMAGPFQFPPPSNSPSSSPGPHQNETQGTELRHNVMLTNGIDDNPQDHDLDVFDFFDDLGFDAFVWGNWVFPLPGNV